MGIRWHRTSRYLFWIGIQKDLSKKEYDWSYHDRLMENIPSDMHVLMNIAAIPQGLLAPAHSKKKNITNKKQRNAAERAKYYIASKDSYMPIDIDKYSEFVRAAVERYDGDGIDDMPGLKQPVKYWQVGNEPPRNLKDYPKLLEITYKAIKETDPDAKVIIGGTTGIAHNNGQIYIDGFDKKFFPILRELGGQYVDIFDLHWYGNATGDYKNCKKIYEYIKMVLEKTGFSKDMPFWITEMSSYSGKAVHDRRTLTFQSETEQAADLLKRYVYPLSFGVKKVFWAFGLIEGFRDSDNYFEHTGLIYNGRFDYDQGRGVKKLAYYTYKKMTEILEGSDWKNIEVVQENDGIYI